MGPENLIVTALAAGAAAALQDGLKDAAKQAYERSGPPPGRAVSPATTCVK